MNLFTNPRLHPFEPPRFAADVSVLALARAVRRHGCAVVEALAPEAARRAGAELTPYLDRVPPSEGAFMGHRTRRTMRLVAKAPSSHALILNQLVQDTLAELFRGECYHHQLSFTQASRIEPGEKAQSLHRDDGPYPFTHPCPPVVLNTIWAIDDFTRDNGATRLVIGSHLRDDAYRPREDEAISVSMPRGSVLLFDGALYHGAGANRTDRSRTALLIGYVPGWLRPEENPQLAVPPDLAKNLPDPLKGLLGYRTHGFLGCFETQQPTAVFLNPLPDVLPAQDLYTPELEAKPIRRR